MDFYSILLIFSIYPSTNTSLTTETFLYYWNRFVCFFTSIFSVKLVSAILDSWLFSDMYLQQASIYPKKSYWNFYVNFIKLRENKIICHTNFFAILTGYIFLFVFVFLPSTFKLFQYINSMYVLIDWYQSLSLLLSYHKWYCTFNYDPTIFISSR